MYRLRRIILSLPAIMFSPLPRPTPSRIRRPRIRTTVHITRTGTHIIILRIIRTTDMDTVDIHTATGMGGTVDIHTVMATAIAVIRTVMAMVTDMVVTATAIMDTVATASRRLIPRPGTALAPG